MILDKEAFVWPILNDIVIWSAQISSIWKLSFSISEELLVVWCSREYFEKLVERCYQSGKSLFPCFAEK